MSDGVTLVGELLERVGAQRWDELSPLLTADYEIVEPASLPWGGTHHGVDGYVALMQRIGETFELEFALDRLCQVDVDTVLLRMVVTFTARTSGRVSVQPVVEVLTMRAGRIARSEVFLKDTAALLTTLA